MPELDPALYGISAESNQIIQTEGIFYGPNMTVEELVNSLESIYCGPAALEFQHLEVCLSIGYFTNLYLLLFKVAHFTLKYMWFLKSAEKYLWW